jgi:hypothetical protein
VSALSVRFCRAALCPVSFAAICVRVRVSRCLPQPLCACLINRNRCAPNAVLSNSHAVPQPADRSLKFFLLSSFPSAVLSFTSARTVLRALQAVAANAPTAQVRRVDNSVSRSCFVRGCHLRCGWRLVCAQDCRCCSVRRPSASLASRNPSSLSPFRFPPLQKRQRLTKLHARTAKIVKLVGPMALQARHILIAHFEFGPFCQLLLPFCTLCSRIALSTNSSLLRCDRALSCFC